VAERLNDRIVAIDCKDILLKDFLDLMTGLSTIPISLDPDALALVRVSPRTPVTVQQKDATVTQVLAAALSPLRLATVTVGSQLVVTRPPASDGELRTLAHPVDDLVGTDPAELTRLAELIVQGHEPLSWEASGGKGVLREEMPNLVIQHEDTLIFRALVFCDRLRVARKLPPRSNFDPALFSLEPRLSRAAKPLSKPVTLNFLQPAAFTQIVDELSDVAGLNILIDWPALAELGWSPDAETTLTANNEPVADVLGKLLRPMDLAYRVIDGVTIQVTTPTALATRLDVEFYAVGDLLSGEDGPEEFLTRVRSELGEPELAGAVLRLDSASKHLIAALPQPQQRKLADLLKAWPAVPDR
jgi:hypothetical protein